MKIAQLLSGFDTMLNNEEHKFLESHNDEFKLSNLDDREQWIVQNLVRKGIYKISNQNEITRSK